MIAMGLLMLPASADVSFELSHCAYIEGIARVPAAVVDPLVPEAFTVVHQGGLASVSIGGANCASASSGEASGPAAFGWLLVRVERPDDPFLAGAGPRVWFYRLDHFVIPGDVYQSVADAAGVEQTPVDAIDVALPATFGELSIVTSGSAHRVTVPVSAPDGGLDADAVRWREFHAVPGGYAMLEATLEPDLHAASLVGVLEPAPGSLAAEVIGDHAVGQVLFGSDFAVGEARMAIIPA
jgi:hypothetical protein